MCRRLWWKECVGDCGGKSGGLSSDKPHITYLSCTRNIPYFSLLFLFLFSLSGHWHLSVVMEEVVSLKDNVGGRGLLLC